MITITEDPDRHGRGAEGRLIIKMNAKTIGPITRTVDIDVFRTRPLDIIQIKSRVIGVEGRRPHHLGRWRHVRIGVEICDLLATFILVIGVTDLAVHIIAVVPVFTSVKPGSVR